MRNIITIILLLSPFGVYAEETIYGTINGYVTTYLSNGIEIPVSGRVINILYDNDKRKSGKTNDDGYFHIEIKSTHRIPLGRKVKFTVASEDYFILSPYDGVIFPPKELTSSGYETKLVIVSNGSQLQTGPLKANFINRNVNERNKKQRYSVQVLSTVKYEKAINVRNSFRKRGFDSFIIRKTRENGLVIHNVFSSSFNNFKAANKEKNRVRSSFNKKFNDAFVKLILK